MWAVVVALSLFGGFAPANPETGAGSSEFVVIVAFLLFTLTMSTVGAFLAARRAARLLPWIMLSAGFWYALGGFADGYTRWWATGAELPAFPFVAFIGNVSWILGIGTAASLLLLLFPEGRLLSPRWRWAAAMSVVGQVVFVTGSAIMPGLMDDIAVPVRSPFAISGAQEIGEWLTSIGLLLVVASIFLSIASLIFRYRRSSADSRQQMKWLISSCVAIVIGIAVSTIIESTLNSSEAAINISNAIISTSVSLVPIAIGVAVLKYRLYDIDVVINKTFVFGALAAFITAVYVAVVVGIGTLLGSSNEPNLGLSIAATAIVAIAFQPVKDRVERVANRLVYGIRRTPYEVLADFSDKVATSYETQEVTPAMARTLKEATGAARAEVWLALDSTLVLSASTEEGRGGDDVIVLDGGGIDAIAGADEVAAVTHQQELLGALAIAKERGEPVTSADRRLLSDLAAQAGIVLRNARLTAELQARLDEISMRAEQIRESRRRIVAAQDRARRRLERDIHDGAQQHLVALAVKLNLAKTMTERKPERAAAMLDQLETEMGDALETLNDLARGIYPPLLKDKGIAAALEARAASAPFELTVVDRSSGRADEATEAAIYFCCLEALQNVAKYAGASTVVVEIDDLDGLGFSVTDDGSGFDPGAVRDGSGLQGMADRLAAVGGTVEIDSSPGRGTTVAGKVGAREMSRA